MIEKYKSLFFKINKLPLDNFKSAVLNDVKREKLIKIFLLLEIWRINYAAAQKIKRLFLSDFRKVLAEENRLRYILILFLFLFLFNPSNDHAPRILAF